MTSGSVAPRLRPRIAVMAGLAILIIGFVGLMNRSGEGRLKIARAALAEAGFGGATVLRGQSPRNMSRCEVGQVRRRGYAYEWSTDNAGGLFCLRVDGRPNRIMLDKAA